MADVSKPGQAGGGESTGGRGGEREGEAGDPRAVSTIPGVREQANGPAPDAGGVVVQQLPALPIESPHDTTSDWRKLHLVQIQPLRDLLVVAFVIGIFYLGYVLSPITIPMLLALTLAYLVEPIVQRLTRKGRLSRAGVASAIIAIMVSVVLVPIGVGITFAALQTVSEFEKLQLAIKAPPAQQQAMIAELHQPWKFTAKFMVAADQEVAKAPEQPSPAGGEPALPTNGGAGADKRGPGLENGGAEPPSLPPTNQPARDPEESVDPNTPASEQRSWFARAAAEVESFRGNSADALGRMFAKQALAAGANLLNIVKNVVGALTYLSFALFLMLFFFFFFCTRYQRVLLKIAELIPKWKRERVISNLRQMDLVIAGFVRGRLIIAAILTVLFVLGYWAIGVPMPLVVGLVVGVLSVAPYLPLIGIPAAIILMFLYPSEVPWQAVWWWQLLAPTGLYFLIQFTDDYVWTPMIQGKTTDMDTPTILFAVIAGGLLFGFYGVLLAIPMAACLKILLRESFWPRFKAWADGRVRDFLPISRYDPTEAKASGAPVPVVVAVVAAPTGTENTNGAGAEPGG
ncbi:MAG: AI-2E family transporter [Phycisphaerales bacterium]|nr:AI-2E family transporter [Phycisphaerales bacterium]